MGKQACKEASMACTLWDRARIGARHERFDFESLSSTPFPRNKVSKVKQG